MSWSSVVGPSRLVVGWVADQSATALVGVGVGALAVLVVGLLAVAAFRRRRPARTARGIPGYEKALTLLAVAVGTGLDAQGMWIVFTLKIHISPEFRGVLFAFLPILLIWCAVRARRNYLTSGETPSMGVEGRALWVIAAVSAVLASTASSDGTEVLARLAVPLIVAWMWHRLIVAERAAAHGVSAVDVAGWAKRQVERVTRALVRWGWISAEHTSMEEEDTSRRIAALATAAYRMHNAPTDDDRTAAEKRWQRMLRRSAYARLMEDPAAILRMRVRLAGMYQSVADTAPSAVSDLAPWTPARRADQSADAGELPEPTTDDPTTGERPTTDDQTDESGSADDPTTDQTDESSADDTDAQTDETDDRPRRTALGSTDDAPILAAIAADYPTTVPTIGQVKTIAGRLSPTGTCSQSKAIRLRDIVRTELTAEKSA